VLAEAPASRVRAARRSLLALALAVAVVKLIVAYRTAGTNDVVHWTEFVAGVHRLGPLDVYTGRYSAVYNHPPLIGWWLAGVDRLSSHVPWLTVRFLVRVPAVLADVLCTVLIFELLRVRRSLREATVAGALVACSPVLFVISGFHGNTDPVFVLLTLAGAWLLADRRMPAAAGVAIGLAVSVKLVPVVAVPVLLVAAWRGRYGLLRLVVGAGAVVVVLWVPVLVRHWRLFLTDVVGYQGTGSAASPWGLVPIAHRLGLSRHQVAFLYGPGRVLILVVCCAIPVLAIWRRPAALPYGVALALVLTWLLSPAFGTQYFAWAAAAAYLLDVWAATAYNALAGILLVQTYTWWSGGFPWNRAVAGPLDHTGRLLCVPIWAVLLVTAVLGIHRIRSVPPDAGATARRVARGPSRPRPAGAPSAGPAG
jgi:Dolichyl-phosphate-mannose-protein mannosyltransferase